MVVVDIIIIAQTSRIKLAGQTAFAPMSSLWSTESYAQLGTLHGTSTKSKGFANLCNSSKKKIKLVRDKEETSDSTLVCSFFYIQIDRSRKTSKR